VPLKRCRLLIIKEVRDCFQNSHDPDGRPWLPIKIRARGNVGQAKPLLDRGLLRASIVTAGRGHVEELTPLSLRFGTNLEYAATHQYGDPNRVPVNAKALAIPLTPAAYRARSPRNFGKPLSLEWPFLVDYKIKGRGKAAALTPQRQYLLRRSVSIPARPFLGITPAMTAGFERIFAEWVAKSIAGQSKGTAEAPPED